MRFPLNYALNLLGLHLTSRTRRQQLDALSRIWHAGSVPYVQAFHRLIRQVRFVPGCIVECGVLAGGGLLRLAWLARLEGQVRSIYGFDSFDGLPPPTGKDGKPRFLYQEFRASYRDCQKFLQGLGWTNIALISGPFSTTLPLFQQPIAFLSVDCDLYESYVTALHWLWPQVVPGGVVRFDDVSPDWPGACRAVEEFSRREGIPLCSDGTRSGRYAVKPAPSRGAPMIKGSERDPVEQAL